MALCPDGGLQHSFYFINHRNDTVFLFVLILRKTHLLTVYFHVLWPKLPKQGSLHLRKDMFDWHTCRKSLDYTRAVDQVFWLLFYFVFAIITCSGFSKLVGCQLADSNQPASSDVLENVQRGSKRFSTDCKQTLSGMRFRLAHFRLYNSECAFSNIATREPAPTYR